MAGAEQATGEPGVGMAVFDVYVLCGADTTSPPFTTNLPCLLLQLCALPPCPLCLEWGA